MSVLVTEADAGIIVAYNGTDVGKKDLDRIALYEAEMWSQIQRFNNKTGTCTQTMQVLCARIVWDEHTNGEYYK